MLRTVLLCAALWAAYAGAAWLTGDFQAGTAEGVRRLQVARAPVPAPAVAIAGPGTEARGDVTPVEFVVPTGERVKLLSISFDPARDGMALVALAFGVGAAWLADLMRGMARGHGPQVLPRA